jgi:hypothetical protein
LNVASGHRRSVSWQIDPRGELFCVIGEAKSASNDAQRLSVDSFRLTDESFLLTDESFRLINDSPSLTRESQASSMRYMSLMHESFCLIDEVHEPHA